MIPFSTKNLFKKEPKKIIRTIGLFYAGIGAWCFFGMFLMKFTMADLQKDEEFSGFNTTVEILQDIWTTYMPLLILIGIGMILFSFRFEQLKNRQVQIQTLILTISTIWVLFYSYACIPYIQAFQTISPEQEPFNILTYIFAIFGFGAVFALMTIPNYRILKKLKVENTAM